MIKDSHLRELGFAHQSLIDYPVDLGKFAKAIGVDVKYGRLKKGVYGMIETFPRSEEQPEVRDKSQVWQTLPGDGASPWHMNSHTTF